MSIWARVSGIFKYKNADGIMEQLKPYAPSGSEGSVDFFVDELRPGEICFSDNLRDFIFVEQWDAVKVWFDRCVHETHPESAILQILEADNFKMCLMCLWLDGQGDIQEWKIDIALLKLVNNGHNKY